MPEAEKYLLCGAIWHGAIQIAGPATCLRDHDHKNMHRGKTPSGHWVYW